GKYKGSPFRTYAGKKYKGGYSDHFPVYITLKKH
ncbi:endonuclease, partial [Oceanihabitans sp.]|nr:endonuclease [Oceanihabitans sp.]